jgi:Cys-tRNA(Pro)/Cys-tRNA(Cys) deacylase
MFEIPPAVQTLSKFPISYRIVHHTNPVESLEQAAIERGQISGQIVRSILFRFGEGNYVMVLIAGPSQISWPKLRAYLGQSRLTLATEEEVLTTTGYRVGAVSPFGLPRPMRILADENLFIPAEISIGSGVRGTAILLKPTDLYIAISNLEVDSFAKNA